MPERSKKEWLELCEKSEGQMFILPDFLKEKADKFKTEREKFQEIIEAMAKREIEQSVLVNEIVYEFRKWLEEHGHPKNWQKDIGFNMDALASGVFVMNVQEPGRRN